MPQLALDNLFLVNLGRRSTDAAAPCPRKQFERHAVRMELGIYLRHDQPGTDAGNLCSGMISLSYPSLACTNGCSSSGESPRAHHLVLRLDSGKLYLGILVFHLWFCA